MLWEPVCKRFNYNFLLATCGQLSRAAFNRLQAKPEKSGPWTEPLLNYQVWSRGTWLCYLVKIGTWLSQPDPDLGKVLVLRVSDYLGPSQTLRGPGQLAGKFANFMLTTGDLGVFPFRVQQLQQQAACQLAPRRQRWQVPCNTILAFL